MKRSRFLKLTASSMAATTFLSFPAFSRSGKQEDSYSDVFRTQMRDDNNHLHEVFVKMYLDSDPELKSPIEVQYIRTLGPSDKMNCSFRFRKTYQPSQIGDYIRYTVHKDEENPYCTTTADIYSTPETDSYDEAIYNRLKTISYIDFKPRTENRVANSEYEKARLVDNTKDLLYELDHHETIDESCFLTTACVLHKGLPDDCAELQTLRAFRDSFMKTHPEGKGMIAEYYRLAPNIVAELNKEPSDEIYDFIYNELVIKCINLIEGNKPELAMYYYKSFTEELSRKILNRGQ